MSRKIAFIERKASEFVSIESVFRGISTYLESEGYEVSFHQLKNHSTAFGVLRNLISFQRPEADIFHITGDIHYASLVLPPDRTLLTIHDLRFLHRTKGFRRFILKKLFLDWPLRRQRFVTAVSEATFDEISSRVDGLAEGITVIENPLREEFLTDRKQKEFDDRRPTILQVGTAPHKNVWRLLEALEGFECRLNLIGSLSDELIRKLHDLRIEYICHRDLSLEEMSAMYKDADIVTFCSTYEGFGMPVIEAQGMRTPLVTSRIRPLSDIAGKGACLVNPLDPSEIRASLERIRTDGEFRAAIVEAGAKNIKRFRPKSIARKYARIYEEILKKRESPK